MVFVGVDKRSLDIGLYVVPWMMTSLLLITVLHLRDRHDRLSPGAHLDSPVLQRHAP